MAKYENKLKIFQFLLKVINESFKASGVARGTEEQRGPFQSGGTDYDSEGAEQTGNALNHHTLILTPHPLHPLTNSLTYPSRCGADRGHSAPRT